ncbi:hypothetical protein RU95_GL000218 [Enterococcus avium]|nr:hypothetical protein RU95_GL000218 [Enterococcus avium]
MQRTKNKASHVYYSQEALLKQKIFESFTKIIRVRPHIQKKGFTDSF